MYEKFVFEDMKNMFDQLDHGIYHLDGEEEIKHLDSLLRIDKIHMIQWVPSQRVADPDYGNPLNWIDLFKRIQNAGKRVLIYASPGNVKELLEKIDRDLTYLSVGCPDEETANEVLRGMGR